MSEHGVAILMSTHTLEVAQEMCQRISIILKGTIIAQGTVGRGPRVWRARDDTDVGLPQTDRRQRAAGTRRDRMKVPFPYLLLPHVWSSRNRARRRERGDLTRGVLFGGVGWSSARAVRGAFWLTGSSPTTTSSATTCCASACRGCS
jgi:hypothetical protein